MNHSKIDNLYKKLSEANIRVVSYDEQTEDDDNVRFLKFYDPRGNYLGFIQDPPTVSWNGTK